VSKNKKNTEKMNPKQNQPSGPAGKESDGVEPTTPSAGGEPIAKYEPSALENYTPSAGPVTPEIQKKEEGDIFDDLASLGRTLDELVPSEKLLVALPVRKPRKDEWIRCHKEIATPVNVYENKETREYFLILPAALEAMEDVVRHVRFTLSVTFSGGAFIWPVPIPSGRRPHSAHISAHAGSEAATNQWIRIFWKENSYEVVHRRTKGKDPDWPEEIPDASAMLRFACKPGGIEVVDSLEHPVVKELLGLS